MPNLFENFTNRRVGRAFLILLVPGIALKRWLALGALGAAAITLGILFALQISLWPGFTSLAGTVSLRGEPSIVRAGVFIAAGLLISFAASAGERPKRTARTIAWRSPRRSRRKVSDCVSFTFSTSL